LDKTVARLRQIRLAWRQKQTVDWGAGRKELPSKDNLGRFVEDISGALFPMRLGPPGLKEEREDEFVKESLGRAFKLLAVQLEVEWVARDFKEIKRGELSDRINKVLGWLLEVLPEIRETLDRDLLAAYQGDPAARSIDEVFACYPGFRAVIHHRLAHLLHEAGAPLLARVISEVAHSKTGIDIHPGARIGPGFFIDHGTGVVIGETTIIGEKVRLYQAVTLGSKGFRPGHSGELAKGYPRHPIVEDDVVIYAGATVLGRITIGRGSTIGGNVWLTRSVPPGSHVTQAHASEKLLGDGAGI